jgi:hypothetical protein
LTIPQDECFSTAELYQVIYLKEVQEGVPVKVLGKVAPGYKPK